MRDKLVATLTAYVDTGHAIGATARRLKVHRHTVDYRLRKIEQLLGRSVRGGPDMILIGLAIFASNEHRDNERRDAGTRT